MAIKVVKELNNVADHQAWSGARDTLSVIVESGKSEEATAFIEELFPDGLTDTELNDFLCFEGDCIGRSLGIEELIDDE